MYEHRVSCKVPVIFIRLKRNLNFLNKLWKNFLKFLKIPPVEAVCLLLMDIYTDKKQRGKQTDIMILIAFYAIFANTSNEVYRCPRRNVPYFGRVFLMLKYTDITQNTYVQS
jgi:hypothetical protein